MRHDWRRIFLFMALALLVMSQAAAGLTNAPNPDKSASSGSTLHEKLSKARESFVKNQ